MSFAEINASISKQAELEVKELLSSINQSIENFLLEKVGSINHNDTQEVKEMLLRGEISRAGFVIPKRKKALADALVITAAKVKTKPPAKPK